MERKLEFLNLPKFERSYEQNHQFHQGRPGCFLANFWGSPCNLSKPIQKTYHRALSSPYEPKKYQNIQSLRVTKHCGVWKCLKCHYFMLFIAFLAIISSKKKNFLLRSFFKRHIVLKIDSFLVLYESLIFMTLKKFWPDQ